MKLMPQNDYLLCKLLNPPKEVVRLGIVFQSDEVPEYEIVQLPPSSKKCADLAVGDVILSNSTPTKFVAEGQTWHLVKIDNVAGKVSK